MAEAVENINSLIDEYRKKTADILNKRKVDELGLEDLDKMLANIQDFSNAIKNVKGFSDDTRETIKRSQENVELLNNQRLVAANQRADQIRANKVQIREKNDFINALRTSLSNITDAGIRFQFEYNMSKLQEEVNDLERTNQRLYNEINIALNGGELELPEIKDKLTLTQIEDMQKSINDVIENKAPRVSRSSTISEEMVAGLTEDEIKSGLDETKVKEHTETSGGSDESSGSETTKEEERIETVDLGSPTPAATTEGSDSGSEDSSEEDKENELGEAVKPPKPDETTEGSDSGSEDSSEETKEDELGEAVKPPKPAATTEGSDSGSEDSSEETKEDKKENVESVNPSVPDVSTPQPKVEEEIDIKDLINDENKPEQNVQRMINYINSMTRDTSIKKSTIKRENMTLAQAVERGLLPSNLGEDKILELANQMGIKAETMDRVVSPNVLDAIMDDKDVKLARANLDLINKRQNQINRNAAILDSYNKFDLEKIGSEDLVEGVVNQAKGLTGQTLDMVEDLNDIKNFNDPQKDIESSDLAREHFDLNGHYFKGDRAERLDKRATKKNNIIREKYAELLKRTDELEKANGKIRKGFAGYRLKIVAKSLQRLKKKEGRISSKLISLMNKETDKYINKKQKDLDRYMNRQGKLQERVDKYNKLSDQRKATADEIKTNENNLENNIKDKDLLSMIERGITRVSNVALGARKKSLENKMGRTELGHLVSQAFDFRLSSAREKLNQRVNGIRNSDKNKFGGVTADLRLLEVMNLANDMKLKPL